MERLDSSNFRSATLTVMVCLLHRLADERYPTEWPKHNDTHQNAKPCCTCGFSFSVCGHVLFCTFGAKCQLNRLAGVNFYIFWVFYPRDRPCVVHEIIVLRTARVVMINRFRLWKNHRIILNFGVSHVDFGVVESCSYFSIWFNFVRPTSGNHRFLLFVFTTTRSITLFQVVPDIHSNESKLILNLEHDWTRDWPRVKLYLL